MACPHSTISSSSSLCSWSFKVAFFWSHAAWFALVMLTVPSHRPSVLSGNQVAVGFFICSLLARFFEANGPEGIRAAAVLLLWNGSILSSLGGLPAIASLDRQSLALALWNEDGLALPNFLLLIHSLVVCAGSLAAIAGFCMQQTFTQVKTSYEARRRERMAHIVALNNPGSWPEHSTGDANAAAASAPMQWDQEDEQHQQQQRQHHHHHHNMHDGSGASDPSSGGVGAAISDLAFAANFALDSDLDEELERQQQQQQQQQEHNQQREQEQHQEKLQCAATTSSSQQWPSSVLNGVCAAVGAKLQHRGRETAVEAPSYFDGYADFAELP
mmetsp:Transcript_49384/g.106320  ORF Transcript_49384/g.106320 Transcript_49384/m.106320 type:complete len:329 (+) Transcript_49384:85-1071(+)